MRGRRSPERSPPCGMRLVSKNKILSQKPFRLFWASKYTQPIVIEMKNDSYRDDDDAQVIRTKDHNTKPLWSIVAGNDGRDEQILDSNIPLLRRDRISPSLPIQAAFPCGRRGSAVSSRSLNSRLTLLVRLTSATDARQPSGETTAASSRGPMRRRTAGMRTHDFCQVYAFC